MDNSHIKYRGLTHRQIEDVIKAEPCAHGKTKGTCGSSMCAVWTIEELNADNPEDRQIDPDAIPFPVEGA